MLRSYGASENARNNIMNKRILLIFVFYFSAISILWAASKPNIIFFLTDDHGYGSWTVLHTANVKDLYFPYSKPQDHGNREEVRWLTLSNVKGLGLKIVAPEPLSMSVLPYTQEELKNARHTKDLGQPKVTEFRVAAQVSGVGNGSCGPATLEQYRAAAKPISYQFYIRPFIHK